VTDKLFQLEIVESVFMRSCGKDLYIKLLRNPS